MNTSLQHILILVTFLAPMVGSIITGLTCRCLPKLWVNMITIACMAVSFFLSCYIAYCVFAQHQIFEFTAYIWGQTAQTVMPVAFLIDQLTAFMMIIVTFVSTLVHVYSIGYMRDEPGYTRFFAYISGFTFAMLILVMSNNFLLLFFGWEGVGLFSYLLIGFWFDREAANHASLKAFLANRVGDLGFLIGIAMVLYYFSSLDYSTAFSMAPHLNQSHLEIHFLGLTCSPITLMTIMLFIGAIGKSAQVPLHIWLEGSMEGPTPISALIHAATMVTAGVFMVARLSPLFELSNTALSVVLILGAITCLFMGILAIVQNDIKRVIAYSTLSQLGYMMCAQGASAFPIGMFHLMTHASFKALLFLAAGSVIVGMHHEQDMRKMGGLRKYMPITYICMLIGALSLSAIPPFSGFYSKDLIIDAVGQSHIYGHSFAFFMVTACAFVTAFYTFRMFFLVFHGPTRMSASAKTHMKESPFSILFALVCLAIPAAGAGLFFFHDALTNIFGTSIYISPNHHALSHLLHEAATHSTLTFLMHAPYTLPFWLAIGGVVSTYICYVLAPKIPAFIAKTASPIHTFLLKKYFIDDLYEVIFGKGGYLVSLFSWKILDTYVLDKGIIHGSTQLIYLCGRSLKKIQSGLIYNYALLMLIGFIVLTIWQLFIVPIH